MTHQSAWGFGSVLLLVSCTAVWADPAPSGSRSPDGLPKFQVPAGFVVEKVAGPPLVRYPLFAAFDDRGRLYVAEGTGTNLPGELLRGKKLGRITVLEDRDGDGRFDTSRVFADELVFPQGVLWHDGAVYVASHPSLWKLEDPEGKGVATRRTELVTGYGFNGNGCDLHGPFLGPDGRLYWTDGRHGYKITTKDGQALEGLAARVWRCRTDGSAIERLCGGGFDNPVEIAFTADGEAIGTMDQGPGDCLLHYVEGGVYPMNHPCVKEFPITGPLLGAVQRYSVVLPAALCGLTRYRSNVFGEPFHNRLFSTQYMLHKVVRHDLIRDGSTFRAQDTDFATTMDHDVRLTDVLEDADGSLLLVDMGAWFTYGFLGNPIPKPEALGAIYRIRKQGAVVADPWGKSLKIEQRPASELIALLDDPRPYVKDQVLSRLARLKDAAVPELSAVVRDTKRSSAVRREAVWALCRIETPAAQQAIRSALADRDESVRLAASHAAGLNRDEEAVSALSDLVARDTLPVRRKAAESLGRIGGSSAVPALLAGLRHDCDRFLEHSIIYALLQIDDRAATLPALADSDPRVRRAGLLALDQMKHGDLRREQITPQLNASDPDLQLTALQIVGRRPEWSDLSQGVVRSWLERPSLDPSQEKALNEVLLATGGQATLQNVVAEALASPRTPAPTRAKLVRVMGQAHVSEFPTRWVKALDRAIKDPDEGVRREVLVTLRARNLTALDRSVVELSRQSDQPPSLRIAALEGVAARIGPLDDSAFRLLSEHVTASTEPLLRLSAARTLGASTLSREQLLRLTQATKGASAIVLRLLLPVFGRSKHPGVGLALVDALEQSPSADVLSPGELDRTLEGYPPQVQERARALRAKLAARQEGKAAYLAQITTELNALKGNADVGHELFLSQKLGCYGCHRAVGRGGTVGPDLSKIGQIRTRAELLESILFPDLTIAPEYRSFQVSTRAGRVATGLIVRDDSDAITLRQTDLADVRIPHGEIEEMAPSTSSLMPEGLEKLITRQELCDLLEFLATQQ